MPDKPLEVGKSAWLNVMRAIRKKRPDLEHISRKVFYPIASKVYKHWRLYHIKNFKNNKADEIESIKSFFDL